MDDDLHVKLFSISLIVDSKEWFSKLTHASIESFEQLKTIFVITIKFKL